MKYCCMAGLLLLMAAGCSSTLETGYKPRPLGSSDSERRAFYAPAFSPDSQNPDAQRAKQLRDARPEQ